MNNEAVEFYREATDAVIKARIQYAQEWQIARAKVNSDLHATQIAIERTKDELTNAYAVQRAAELTLQYAMGRDSDVSAH